MPLASSRSSTSKAGNARKQSLPSTIDSSTRVTRNKALKRRASMSAASKKNRKRRDAADKENNSRSNGSNPPSSPGPTPYWKVAEERQGGEKNSPRLTRSASKNKKPLLPPLATREEERGGGVVLNFSPPDQIANAEREKNELERRERERDKRIANAKQNGQLLVYSPGGSQREAFEKEDDNASTQFCLDLSPSNNDNMEVDKDEAASSDKKEPAGPDNNEMVVSELSSLKESVNSVFEYIKTNPQMAAAANAQLQSAQAADKLAVETQVLRCEALTQSNTKLEETNQALQSNVKELEDKFATAKETYLCDKTRLESKLESTKRESAIRMEGLEESKKQLEQQLSTTQKEKTALLVRVSELEKDIAAEQEKLAESKEKLETLRHSGDSDKAAFTAEIDRLSGINAQLTSELEAGNMHRAELEKKIGECEALIADFENELLPESESQLEEAVEQLRQQRESTAEVEEKLQASNVIIQDMKLELDALKTQTEEERVHFQTVNEDNTRAYAKLKNEDGTKQRKIEVLSEELAGVKDELANEKKRSDQSAEESSRVENAMEKELAGLKGLVKEFESKLQTSKEATIETEAKLAKAIEQIEAVSNAKEEAMSECTNASETVGQLRDNLAAEKDHSQHLEEELRNRQLRISDLDEKLKMTTEERNDARNRMNTFDVREEELFRKLRESDRIRRELHNRVMQLSGNIRVYVRVRPPLPGEMEKSMAALRAPPAGKKGKKRKHEETQDEEELFRFPGVYDREETSSSKSDSAGFQPMIEVTEPYKDRGGLNPRRKKWKFGFDNVFSPSQGQEDVWEATEPLVQSAIDGYNVCIFAYGQTGSGKTYTMLGEPSNPGIISRSVEKLFETKHELEALSRGETQVEISVELLEIYNEQVRDLLAPNSGPNGREINLKVTSNEAVGNILVSASSVGDVMDVLELAQKRRCVKATLSNAESSRSHMLFTIHFHVQTKDGVSRSGKLHVCDLAGSERLNKSGTNAVIGGSLLTETKYINTSLSVLSNVIERLQSGNPHVPYRESKLTFLLQNSLGGNSKTLAIVCCNPVSSHFHESLCSLRFAAKVNKVDLKAVANFSC